METKEQTIAKCKLDIAKDIEQITKLKTNKNNFANLCDFFEQQIKVWRVHKMTDELFLWYVEGGNYTLYLKQFKKLTQIQSKLVCQHQQKVF